MMWDIWFPDPAAARLATVVCWWLGSLLVCALAGSVWLSLHEVAVIRHTARGERIAWWVWCWLEPMLALIAALLFIAASLLPLIAFAWW